MSLVYCPGIEVGKITRLSVDESHHLTRVLRKSEGEKLHICDGKGNLYSGNIASVIKKQAYVQVVSVLKSLKSPESKLHIAIAPTKNISRFEWFVEKATGIGIAGIIPIHTKHSERDKINILRLEKIIISAMKQSGHLFKPELHPLTDFTDVIQLKTECRFIGYSETLPQDHLIAMANSNTPTLMLIGPEGDFTKDEYRKASGSGFYPVKLGNSRLRTETAGVVAAQIFNSKGFIE
jgi:16S rRNA (uracil1498-N3)-methyltransferase